MLIFSHINSIVENFYILQPHIIREAFGNASRTRQHQISLSIKFFEPPFGYWKPIFCALQRANKTFWNYMCRNYFFPTRKQQFPKCIQSNRMNMHNVGRIFPIFLYLKTRALKTRKHLTIRRVYAVPLHRKFTF